MTRIRLFKRSNISLFETWCEKNLLHDSWRFIPANDMSGLVYSDIEFNNIDDAIFFKLIFKITEDNI